MSSSLSLVHNDYLHNLLLKEGNLCSQQPIILPEGNRLVTPAIRTFLVRWIRKQGKQLDATVDILGAAIVIFDHVISRVCVPIKYANCLALTTLYLGFKLLDDEIGGLTIPEICQQCGVTYSAAEILRMERQILVHLNWDLFLPSIERFTYAILKKLGNPPIDHGLLHERIESIYSNWYMVSTYRPSHLAFSLLFLMFESEEPLEDMIKIFRLKENEIYFCASQMDDLFNSDSDKEN